jgi:mRNA-degrading endonuclease toxin of MazEF toxin-antitoxin module
MTPFILDAEQMYGGALRRGDIVIAHREGGEAFFVVLQDDVLNDGLPSVVCAELELYTKKRHKEIFPHEMLVLKDESGLPTDAVAVTHKLFPVDRRSVRAKIGELKAERLQGVYRSLDILFGRFRDEDV